MANFILFESIESLQDRLLPVSASLEVPITSHASLAIFMQSPYSLLLFLSDLLYSDPSTIQNHQNVIKKYKM